MTSACFCPDSMAPCRINKKIKISQKHWEWINIYLYTVWLKFGTTPLFLWHEKIRKMDIGQVHLCVICKFGSLARILTLFVKPFSESGADRTLFFNFPGSLAVRRRLVSPLNAKARGHSVCWQPTPGWETVWILLTVHTQHSDVRYAVSSWLLCPYLGFWISYGGSQLVISILTATCCEQFFFFATVFRNCKYTV